MSTDTGITLEEIVKSGVKMTPMMDQYYNIRRQYPGILLMFRMGDFYEVFFEDAVNASRLLRKARKLIIALWPQLLSLMKVII